MLRSVGTVDTSSLWSETLPISRDQVDHTESEDDEFFDARSADSAEEAEEARAGPSADRDTLGDDSTYVIVERTDSETQRPLGSSQGPYGDAELVTASAADERTLDSDPQKDDGKQQGETVVECEPPSAEPEPQTSVNQPEVVEVLQEPSSDEAPEEAAEPVEVDEEDSHEVVAEERVLTEEEKQVRGRTTVTLHAATCIKHR